ncbi:MAG: ATP-binding cassette domain-containing protein [Caldicoprobacterales bacterium]|jgi:putative multiple sugar transport system ATP-binding protein|nr:ATP-binding cassette domain-containing protein [Clostridiales bacterium]
MAEYLLEMEKITKEFPGVIALSDVTFRVKEGEIHALVGENGAGKSTLMNVLSGVLPYGSYTGQIIFKGAECRFRNIRDSEAAGIAIIHQELALSPYMTIAENIFLGNERASNGVINWDETNREAVKLMKKVGLNEKHTTQTRNIGVGKQQLVEIAKALSKNCELLILDEPTAALNDEDSGHLLNLLQTLNKEHGMTCILISHKIHEVIRIAHSITILRDGKTIGTLDNTERVSEGRIIKDMVGRELTDRFPKHIPKIDGIGFEIKNWVVHDPLDEERVVIEDVSMYFRKGEIVGLAGLMGAGRTELAMSVFGRAYGKRISGTLIKDGKELTLRNIGQAIASGIAYVTEDRKTAGLVHIHDIKRNITLANLKAIARHYIINEDEEIVVGKDYKERLDIKAVSVFQRAGNLSGGNQQKVVLSKWIFANPDVLILDEPTRGIDVGAKYEIYKIILQLASAGKCIILISSELPEILGLTDRLYIMNEGRVVGEMITAEATQESIMTTIIRSSAG